MALNRSRGMSSADEDAEAGCRILDGRASTQGAGENGGGELDKVDRVLFG